MMKVLKNSLYTTRWKMRPFIIMSLQFLVLLILLGNLILYSMNVNTTGNEGDVRRHNKDGFKYYKLYANSAESSEIDTTKPFLLTNMKKTLYQLRSSKNFLYAASSIRDYLGVEVGDLTTHFQTSVYDNKEDFLAFSEYPGYYQKHPELKLENNVMIGNEKYTWVSSASFDQNAFEHYGLNVTQGRIFNDLDYIYDLQQNNISILLGAEYRPYFKVGDEIDLYTNGIKMKGVVVGILQANTTIKNDETYEHLGNPEVVLDYSIIVPYLDFTGVISSEMLKEYVANEYINQLTGTLIFNDNEPIKDINSEIRRINDYYIKNHIFTVKSSAPNNGLAYFQSEEYVTMVALGMVMGLTIIFYCFSICVGIENEINKNIYRHSVENLIGICKRSIIASYVIQLLLAYIVSIIAVLLINDFWLYQVPKFWLLFAPVVIIQVVFCICFICRKINEIDVGKGIKKEIV